MDHSCLWSKTVRGTSYLDMLKFFLEPQLESDVLNTVVFQHDRAPPHFALIFRDYLNRTFPGWWIGHLTFMWCYIKSHVYRVKITSLHQLRERIMEAVNSITPDQLQSVQCNGRT
ncbi:hypothetical protein PR048_026104, partial [Dryococelus australis]